MRASHTRHPPHWVRSVLGTRKSVHLMHASPGVGLTVPAGHEAHTLPAASSRPAGHWGAGQVAPAGHSAARAAARRDVGGCCAVGPLLPSIRTLMAPHSSSLLCRAPLLLGISMHEVRSAAVQCVAHNQPALTARCALFIGLVAGEGAGGTPASRRGVEGAGRAGGAAGATK